MKEVFVALFFVAAVSADLDTYYMTNNCGSILDVSFEDAAILKLTPMSHYNEDLYCTVTVETEVGKHFLLQFRKMDIYYSPGCTDDYLMLYDGQTTSSSSIPGMSSALCGTTVPFGVHSSTGQYLTLQFHSGSSSIFQNSGFELLLTEADVGPCDDDELQCSNGDCISSDLACDGYNHCGDSVNHCWWSMPVVAAITSGSSALLSVIALITACCACCRNRRSAVGVYQPLRGTYDNPPFYQQGPPPSYGTTPRNATSTAAATNKPREGI